MAFGASSLTSAYVPLPKDDLLIEKVLEKPAVVGVVNKELDPDVKLTQADLKVGAGKTSEEDQEAHEKFFSEPTIKINSVSMGPTKAHDSKPPMTTSKQLKRPLETTQSGGGHGKKLKCTGRGIRFQ